MTTAAQRSFSSLYRPMRGRHPDEPHRVSSPLELLFDLCFVFAIAQAGLVLEEKIEAGQPWGALGAYLPILFAIWWAWMNFTWFASAYDTDDALYRVLVFLQIGGTLVIAAGVPDAGDGNFHTVTWGYAIIRIGTVLQWLRAARDDEFRRGTALFYAFGVLGVQICWILRLFLIPPGGQVAVFCVLVVAEIAVPMLGERRIATSYHPEHVADRYGAFTLIVLGESVTAATIAIENALSHHDHRWGQWSLAVSGLIAFFVVWWLYFDRPSAEILSSWGKTFLFGYGHYFVFGGIAAIGAGIAVNSSHLAESGAESTTTAGAAEVTEATSTAETAGEAGGSGAGGAEHAGHLTDHLAAASFTVPIALVLLLLAGLRIGAVAGRTMLIATPVAAVLVLLATFVPGSPEVTAGILVVLIVVRLFARDVPTIDGRESATD